MSLRLDIDRDDGSDLSESNQKDEFLILSLDGGGVRALFQLYFLSHMEAAICKCKELNEQDEVECTLTETLTSDLFDMYAGSSAGGMLATLLGLRRFSMQQVREKFGAHTVRAIFDKSLLDMVFGQVQFRPKYDGEEKRRALKECLGATTRFSKVANPDANEIGGNKDSENSGKIVMVTAYDLQSETNKSRFFLNCDYECGDECAPFAWELADATSAAPTYFPAVHIQTTCVPNLKSSNMVVAENETCNSSECPSHHGGKNDEVAGVDQCIDQCRNHCEIDSWFVDGGVNRNNPALTAALLARRHLRKQGKGDVRFRVLSIGAGLKKMHVSGEAAKEFGGVQWFQNNLLGIVMDETHTHEELQLLMDEPERDYLRINGSLDDFDVNDALDDTSVLNIRRLKLMSQAVWRKRARQVFEFLNIPFRPECEEPLALDQL